MDFIVLEQCNPFGCATDFDLSSHSHSLPLALPLTFIVVYLLVSKKHFKLKVFKFASFKAKSLKAKSGINNLLFIYALCYFIFELCVESYLNQKFMILIYLNIFLFIINNISA